MRPIAIVTGLITLATLGSGCAGRMAPQPEPGSGAAWPPDQPRIRLVRIIDFERQGRSAKWVRWLSDPEPRTSFVRPFGVAWDSDGILVADPGARRVARIEKGGRVRWSREDLFLQPIGVARCAGGIVVSDSRAGRVALLNDRLHRLRWLAEDLQRPTGVACSGDRIIVAETGRHAILVLEPDGSRRTIGKRGEGSGEFNFPTSVAIDDETLLVGDTLNFRIQRFDIETGRFLGSFGRLGDHPGDMPRGKAIAVDPEGHLWVSDALLDIVSLYDVQGQLLLSIGATGSEPGQFAFPAGIAIRPDGKIVVADSLNRRLQVLTLVSTPESGG